MKRILILLVLSIVLAIIASSCAPDRESQPSRQTLADLQERRDQYVAQVTDDVYTERCDKLTFKALFSAFGKRQDLSKHEYSPGEWHRDVKPCYPDDSKSEISFDPLLMILHHAVSHNDHAAVVRLIEFGEDADWKMGDVPSSLTYTPQLAPLARMVRDATDLASIGSIVPSLEGFRAHLVALSVWLVGRVDGRLPESYFRMLRKISRDNPGNPLFTALHASYDDGDQSEAIAILSRDFPTGELPSGMARYGWGSCPDAIFFIAAVAAMEGK